MASKVRAHISGLLIASLCAIVAYMIHLLPFPPFTIESRHPVDPLLISLIIGLSYRSCFGLPQGALPGVRWSSKALLAISIALLGAKIDFSVIVKHSQESIWLSVFCVFMALVITEWLGVKLGVKRRLSRLIAIGTAICGGTAIAVTSGTLGANEEEVALSMASVTLFGLLCVVLLPPLGLWLDLSQSQFGLWSGLVVHATPQVMATAYSYGAEAGEIALIVKMTRILLLAPLLLLLNIWRVREERVAHQTLDRSTLFNPAHIFKVFPPFLLAFLILALCNSMGFISQDLSLYKIELPTIIMSLSKALMMIAMAAIGLLVELSKLLHIGPKPIIGGLLSTIVIALISLSLII